MIIIKKEAEDFEQLKALCWCGALDVLKRIEQQGREEDYMNYLAEVLGDCDMTDTELNDFIWFGSDTFEEAYNTIEEAYNTIEEAGNTIEEAYNTIEDAYNTIEQDTETTTDKALVKIREALAGFNLTYKPK